MPLFEMSANVQEGESLRRKRSFGDFSNDAIKVDAAPNAKVPHMSTIQPTGDCLLPPVQNNLNLSSPQGSPALTEAGSSTPARNSPSPKTPTKTATQQTTGNVTAPTATTSIQKVASTNSSKPKRVHLTPAEKEAREKEAAEKKKEREEKAAIKAAEKAKQEEDKAARAKEREEKRKKKEEEEQLKAQQRDEKKRKKEEELQRQEEEKQRKLRSQPKLNSFFSVPRTPKKDNSRDTAGTESPTKSKTNDSPSKPTQSRYERMFQPFFVKENTWVANIGPELDEAERKDKSDFLDQCLKSGANGEITAATFNASRHFRLTDTKPRGMVHHPVKHIMENAYKSAEKLGNAGTGEGDRIFSRTREQLSKVPMKVIAFSRDVRPPYYGTVTYSAFAMGTQCMAKLARRSTGKRLPLDYDYDSEAEWQEEEGEDLDGDDDEEEPEDEDDMEEFLDDSEDAGLSRRIFANTMEPESTGICFEDENRRGCHEATYDHKMEFIHDAIDQDCGVDPFTGSYWESTTKQKQPDGGSNMPPPSVPANAFAAMRGSTAVGAASNTKLVKEGLMNQVKQAILDNKALSKIGIVDVVFQRFRDEASRTEVKNTIELVAEKKGTGRAKEWTLRAGHEIAV